jgi:hypothetical protein
MAWGGVTGATGVVTPTALKTDAGTLVSSLTMAGLVAWKPALPLGSVEPPVNLMITSPATTSTTSPTASQVKRPAGRPPRALTGAFLETGGLFEATGGLFDAGRFATVLLVLKPSNLVDWRGSLEFLPKVLSSFDLCHKR